MLLLDDTETQETTSTEETQETSTETTSEDTENVSKTENSTDEKSDDQKVEKKDEEIEVRSDVKPDNNKNDSKDDDEIDPAELGVINKVVDKRLEPLNQQIRKQQDEIEVNDFILKNPEYTSYKSTILKYISHEAYKNIPVKNIAAMVSAKDQQRIGAEKERAAFKKAQSTKEMGNTAKSNTNIDWRNASKEDFEKKKREILFSNR